MIYKGCLKSHWLKPRGSPCYLKQKSGEKVSPTAQKEVRDGEKPTFLPEVLVLPHLH